MSKQTVAKQTPEEIAISKILISPSATETDKMAALESALKSGVNPNNIRDVEGASIAGIAAFRGDLQVLEHALSTIGIDPNRPNINKKTPLMVAAARGKPDAMNVLLSHEADVNLVDTKGKTALDYAQTSTNAQVCSDIILSRKSYLERIEELNKSGFNNLNKTAIDNDFSRNSANSVDLLSAGMIEGARINNPIKASNTSNVPPLLGSSAALGAIETPRNIAAGGALATAITVIGLLWNKVKNANNKRKAEAAARVADDKKVKEAKQEEKARVARNAEKAANNVLAREAAARAAEDTRKAEAAKAVDDNAKKATPAKKTPRNTSLGKKRKVDELLSSDRKLRGQVQAIAESTKKLKATPNKRKAEDNINATPKKKRGRQS